MTQSLSVSLLLTLTGIFMKWGEWGHHEREQARAAEPLTFPGSDS